jgi:hypothetical protein
MTTNKHKIILDLCVGTGSWSNPYKEAGYDVRLITLPDHNVLTYEPPENVYGILAAPPCTEFSLAKRDAKRDFFGAIEIVRACMNIIWNCRAQGKLKWWALENPVGFMRQFLGHPHYTFKHWEYKEPVIKPTDIWGYFNLPKPLVKSLPNNITQRSPSGKTISIKYSNNNAEKRAITPPGFAQAFFKANS